MAKTAKFLGVVGVVALGAVQLYRMWSRRQERQHAVEDLVRDIHLNVSSLPPTRSQTPVQKQKHAHFAPARIDRGRGHAHLNGPKSSIPFYEVGLINMPDGLHAVPVGPRMFVTNAHLFRRRSDGAFVFEDNDVQDMWIKVNNRKVYFSLSANCVVADANCDVALFSIPSADNSVQQFKSLRNKFVTEEELHNLHAFRVNVLATEKSPMVHVGGRLEFKSTKFKLDGIEVQAPVFIQYAGFFGPGDCGRPIMVESWRGIDGKIMGIHAANRKSQIGEASDGFGVPITLEMIEAMEQELSHDEWVAELNGPYMAKMPRDLVVDGPNIHKIERIERDLRVWIPRDTKLRKSPLAPHLGLAVTKDISVKHADDERLDKKQEPFLTKLEMMAKVPTIETDEDLLAAVSTRMTIELNRTLRWPSRPRILTIEEVLNTTPGLIDAPDYSTSVGYPLVLRRDKSCAKREFFSIENGQWIPSDSVMDTYHDLVSWIESDTQTPPSWCVWLAYYKDELVKPTKVATGNTRLIYAGPIAIWMWIRQRIGTLLTALAASWKETNVAVGCNALSWDMDDIVNHVTEVNDKVFYGDVSNWDITYQRDLMRVVWAMLGHLAADKIPDFNLHEWDRMCRLVRRMPIQFGDLRVWLVNLLTSGNPGTTPVNSWGHEMIFTLAFATLCPGERFADCARVKVCGDDIVWSVEERLIEQFNEKTYAQLLSSWGYTYTNDQKTAELSGEPVRPSEGSFLGCYPVMFRGKYMGALRKESIHHMLVWSKNDAQYPQVVETALKFASAWGEEYFSLMKNTVLKAIPRTRAHPSWKSELKKKVEDLVWFFEVNQLAEATTGVVHHDHIDNLYEDPFDTVYEDSYDGVVF